MECHVFLGPNDHECPLLRFDCSGLSLALIRLKGVMISSLDTRIPVDSSPFLPHHADFADFHYAVVGWVAVYNKSYKPFEADRQVHTVADTLNTPRGDYV